MEETQGGKHFDLAPNLIPVHCITPSCSDALVSSPNLFPPARNCFLYAHFKMAAINVLSRKKKENNCLNNSKLVWFKPILCCFPKMLGFPNWPFLTCICLMHSVCKHWSFSNDNQPSLRLNINCDLIAEAKQLKCLTLFGLEYVIGCSR